MAHTAKSVVPSVVVPSVVAACCLAVVVAGCGVARVGRSWAEPHAARALWNYAGAGKPFLIEVHNPPPGVDGAAVAAAFPSPPTVAPAARFVAEPAAAAHPEYRFVIQFGAPASADGADACAGAIPVLRGGDSLQAAFCHRERVLAEVRGEGLGDSLAGRAAGPDLRAVLYDVARHLVPPPEFEDRDAPDPPPS